MPPFFRIPMNLPHAARVLSRLRDVIERHPRAEELGHAFIDELDDTLAPMERLLAPVVAADENPPGDEASRLAVELARGARGLVALVEREGVTSDRLGQCVRNFFECLELGEEGAAMGLRAGESPDSLQRPGPPPRGA